MNLKESLELWKQFHPLTWEQEATTLYNAVLTSPLGEVVEVGSAWGGTTVVLIGAAEEVNKKVYSVDPYPEELEGKANNYTNGLMKELKDSFRKNILEGPWKNITQFNEDISKCVNKLPERISVAFIDGCHEFSCVKNEITTLFPKMVPGGLMFIHDIEWTVGQISDKEGTGVCEIKQWVKDNNIEAKLIEDTRFLLLKKE